MAKKNPPQPPTTQPKAWEAQKHPPGMQPGDFYDDFEEAPGAQPEAGKAAPDDPIHAMSEADKKALRDKNEAAAKAFMSGQVKAEGLDKIDETPPAPPKMSAEAEAAMKPKAYRVDEEFTMGRPGGSNTLLRKGKFINDREYDVALLKKQGCRLTEVELP